MHISTHHDRIWRADCQQKEDAIVEQLKQQYPNAHVQLVDCLQFDTDKTVVTDNVFIHERANTVQVNPEFWHIYLCDPVENQTPTHRFNCMLNRLSGERLLLLYKLHERNLINDNVVSFNCLYHTRDPDEEQRRAFFDQVHGEMNWPHWDWAYLELRDRVPITVDYDPDSAALESEVTIVTESYVSDSIIAFSEKIFRALQTPRPWLLFCSPGSVQLLKDSGFDVLDDVVDHSYDGIVDQEQRLSIMLDQLDHIVYNAERCERAVLHNQQRLQDLKAIWKQNHS
jgi:hypothetical protein